MNLSTWAATLSITTSLVVLTGERIVRTTEPRLRTSNESSQQLRSVKAEPSSFEFGAASLPSGPSRDARPVQASKTPTLAGSEERRTRTVKIILDAASLCGVPPGIALRLAARESSMRQWDSQGNVLRSSSGAVGMFQIKPSSSPSKSLDLETEWGNAVAGLCHLSSLKGTWREKLLSYRVGSRGTRTASTHAYADVILGEVQ